MIFKRPAIPFLILVALVTLTVFNTNAIKDLKPSMIVNQFKNEHFHKVQIVNNISPHAKDSDTVLILSSIGGKESYGKDRTIADLIKTLHSFRFNRNQINLGLLVGNPEEYETVVEYFKTEYFKSLRHSNQNENFHKVTIVRAPFIEDSFNQIDRTNRHDDKVQRLRRRNIARSRNFILNTCLDIEKYTLFIDSDIVKIHHTDMIKRFIKSKHDIIVPRIVRGNNPDYDKNSWRGTRTKPNEKQYEQMDKGQWDQWDYVPRDVEGEMVHFESFLNANNQKSPNDATKSLEYNFELDSVGGAILFAKSFVYHQGIQFPPNYIIGTTWERLEGYDGIETEGLCYIAKSCGYKCHGFPNLVAEHSLE